MKKAAILIICLFLFLSSVGPTFAQNKYGIHILDTSDLKDAASLVNSNGGDWGYVTIVIREDQRSTKLWEDFFQKLSEYHLIPIVRLATTMTQSGWSKPDFENLDIWVTFLNSVSWPTDERIVVIGNEPNHAKEWEGEVSPQEYGHYLAYLSTLLKESSSEFLILPAGLDASAPNSTDTKDEEQFITEMLENNSSIFNYIDAWNSHSYPNPDFSGSPTDTGRGSIRTYDWELSLLKNLGIEKDFKVYITETGWAHSGENNNNFIDPEQAGKNLDLAYGDVWEPDDRVVAVTPFVLNYPYKPFDMFSWKRIDGSYYSFFEEVKGLSKGKNIPALAKELASPAFLYCQQASENLAVVSEKMPVF